MKNVIKKYMSLGLCLIFFLNMFFFTTPVSKMVGAASATVERAIDWAIAIANDNTHGYSQQVRWGPDYDCSSFVISAFRSAGVDTGHASYTGDMKSASNTFGVALLAKALQDGKADMGIANTNQDGGASTLFLLTK